MTTTRRSCKGFVPWIIGATALLTACGLSSESSPTPDRASAAAEITAVGEGDPILDPIPEDPRPSELALTIKEFAQFPKSEPFPATTDPRLVRWARINYLGDLPDGSHRMYTPDLNGTLYFLKNGVPHPYLDVRSNFPEFFSGRGLGSGFGFVAFDPDFARNGKFYTTHSEAFNALTNATPDFTQANAVIQSVVTEWTATDPRADTFAGTHREILRIGFASFIHAIQQISFNPTARRHDADFGLLYLAVGEGGQGVNGTDPQNLAIPHGKILRIDPRGRNSANGKYGVPRGNPFVNQAGALGEIYAYGMRDPHRFSWDTGGTHRLFLGHIGEKDVEGVWDILPGDNLGWSEREGTFVFDRANPCDLFALPANDAMFGYVYPVAEFDHNPPPGFPCQADVGHAISGGVVYRGHAAPALIGKYVFGDLVDGRIFYTNEREMQRGKPRATIHEMKILDDTGRLMTMQELVGDTRVDLRFSSDDDDNLYLLAKSNGKIWKVTGARPLGDVFPTLVPSLVAHYDFEQPVTGKLFRERDRGFSGTTIDLINGGAAMRVKDGAHLKSTTSIQLQQLNPTTQGEDDWKAGIYSPTGVPTLHAFNAAHGITLMGWFKMTGTNPSLNTETPDPTDFYNAIGLTGILTGDSEGHAVRALLEIINVNGELHLVALGRRIDGSASQTFAANDPWPTLLPQNEWVFLAATFDFNTGAMALYRNGERLAGFYAVAGDPWGVAGGGRHETSATDPRGIKIGGSFPQNTQERNPCNCRMDSLMYLDRVVLPIEIKAQYRLVTEPSRW
jgi:glucose/arabinose dehydrogenase